MNEDTRTESALEKGGWADMRPDYRVLLRRLKERDPAAFDEASERFSAHVEPAIAQGSQDPVATWAEYGAWLARRLGDGRLVALDDTGLAHDAEAAPIPGHVLLYLPDETRDPATAILRPARPSTAQKAALKLLVR